MRYYVVRIHWAQDDVEAVIVYARSEQIAREKVEADYSGYAFLEIGRPIKKLLR